MAAISDAMILKVLGDIAGPDGRDLVSAGMVSGLAVEGGHVSFAIAIDPKDAKMLEPLRLQAEKAVAAQPGVLSVSAVLTAHRTAPGNSSPHPAPGRGPNPGQPAGHAHLARPQRAGLPGVRHIIAVASGKGGVGKSTTAANLALGLQKLGLAVGLMDADIYGPSQPRLMGMTGKPVSHDGKKLEPMENYGVKVMSMGFMIPEDTPMIWRGPMVMSAVNQLLRDVNWGTLDVLVADLPPGTGDAQLTMAQQVPLSGAVIVSTPQDIALIDARKGLNMFRKVAVPVLGIIENMSWFSCPHCGQRSDIFAHGGARREAVAADVEFLGEIPLDIAIRETSDDGKPIVAAAPESPHAIAYLGIAKRLWEKLNAPAEESGAREGKPSGQD